MRLPSTRSTTALVASTALAGTMLVAAASGGTASAQPLTTSSVVGRGAPTSDEGSSAAGATRLLAGDVRASELGVWDAAGSAPLPGDVRVWELAHPSGG